MDYVNEGPHKYSIEVQVCVGVILCFIYSCVSCICVFSVCVCVRVRYLLTAHANPFTL